jgi:hypothetical protein
VWIVRLKCRCCARCVALSVGSWAMPRVVRILEYALKEGPTTAAAVSEPIFFCGGSMCIMAPIIPKESFHSAGNFGEHHKEVQKARLSHPVLWIMFFQNADTIIGPDEPNDYP